MLEGGLVTLGRLADALSELGARLRVGGMTDDEARQLPVQLDAETLLSFGSSTWMTDAVPVDVLRELRDRDGRSVIAEPYEQAAKRYPAHCCGLNSALGDS